MESIEKIFNKEHESLAFLPPREILRFGEELHEINQGDLKDEISKLEEAKIIKNEIASFLRRWTIRGLAALTLAYSHPEVSPEITEKNKFLLNNSANNAEEVLQPGAVPEIVVYGHEDYKTNAILNFFTKNETLPEEIKSELEVKMFFNHVASFTKHAKDVISKKRNVPDDFYKFGQRINAKKEKLHSDKHFQEYRESQEYIDEVLELEYYIRQIAGFSEFEEIEGDKSSSVVLANISIDDEYKEKIKTMNLAEAKKCLADEQYTMESNSLSDEFSVEVYDQVWTMHQNNGNPKVGFSEHYSERSGFGDRAYYNSETNSMFLGVGNGKSGEKYLDDWLAELSHSHQYTEQSEKIIKEKEICDHRFLDSLATIQGKNIDEVYNEFHDTYLYNKPGSIEFDAHKIIEPQLKKKFTDATTKSRAQKVFKSKLIARS